MKNTGRHEIFEALCQRHGRALQEKFASASVAVCGLGGLGSNVAVALARAGIGRLHLIDFDKVELSNINRQQYFIKQIGQEKARALAESLREICPYTEIKADTIRVTEENAGQLLQQEDIVCEAFDEAEGKAMLVNFVLENMPDKYIVAASGMAGMSSANTIVTRKAGSKLYICGDGISDVSEGIGLVSSRVMVCAAHQAHMILRLISGEHGE